MYTIIGHAGVDIITGIIIMGIYQSFGCVYLNKKHNVGGSLFFIIILNVVPCLCFPFF